MAGDGLFIIGSENFDRALDLGMYPALAYLVLARGTQRNNTTTAWSAKAVKNAIGVRWQKCHDAIGLLLEAGLVSTKPSKIKTRPLYRLAPIEGDKVFLPNALVDGLDDSAAPLRRIRETQSADVLKLLIAFYRLQNLADEHGINRDWLHNPAEVEYVMDLGQFAVWAVTRENVYRAQWDGELAKPWKRNPEGFWDALRALDSMGLIELAWYVTDADGELLYPFNQDVRDAIFDYIEAREIPSGPDWEGDWQFLTFRHQINPQFIGLYRVRFRTPHTSMTGEWAAEVQRMTADILKALRP